MVPQLDVILVMHILVYAMDVVCSFITTRVQNKCISQCGTFLAEIYYGKLIMKA